MSMNIPLMDYIVVTKNDRNTLPIVLECIQRQSNLNRIIVVQSEYGPERQKDYLRACRRQRVIHELLFEGVGLAYARKIGIAAVTTKYFVFVDGDVYLSDNWIEQMWKRWSNDGWVAWHGMLYRNRAHHNYMIDYECWVRFVEERMYTHNTIIKTDLVKDWDVDDNVNAFEDYLLTKHLFRKGAKIRRVPVFAKHDHQGSDFRAAVWGGAGARETGKFENIWQVLKFCAGAVGGGIKRTFRTNVDWFTVYALKQAFGTLYGYLRWKKFLKKNF